jgi:hypothetical protein
MRAFLVFWLIAAAAPGIFVAGARAQEVHLPQQRVYIMGNSLTQGIRFDEFIQLVEAGGCEITMGRTIGAGVYLDWFWKNPGQGFTLAPFGTWDKALREYEWDALTLQPYWKSFNESMDHARKLVAYALDKSPGIQVYVYAQWPRVDGGNYHRDWWDSYDPTKVYQYPRAFWEDYVKELRRSLPDGKPARLIPVGHVLYLLDQKMRAGQVPGLNSIFDIYRDNQHLDTIGSWVIGTTFYATTYGRDPRRLPTGGYGSGGQAGDPELTEDVAGIISETVWEVVSTHPMTGVRSDEPVEVVTPILIPAVAGEPYRMVIQHAFGNAPYTWAMADGALPEGLTLGDGGVITGTATAPGRAEFTVQVQDGTGKAATRQLSVAVEEDTAPQVVAEPLPDVRCGEACSIKLKTQGGNEPLAWHAVGAMPPGLALQLDGTLTGTVGKPGAYRFRVRVTDGDLAEPEQGNASFDLKALPPGPDVLMVPGFDKAKDGDIIVDGRINEPLWELDHAAEKLVRGQAFDNEVGFTVVWRPFHCFIAVKVMDDDIQTSAGEPEENDSVEIFVDAMNNREKVYNNDDRRIVIDAAGRVRFYGESRFLEAAATRIDGGYTVEIHLSAHNLQAPAFKRPWTTMGLDIAVNDIDSGGESSQIVWRGNVDNAKVPDSFGTLIFVPRDE